MGHCDSPARFGRDSEFFGNNQRPAELDPSRISGNHAGISDRPRSAIAWLLLAFLQAYKLFLSPFFGGACKYHPSCSNYAYQAIKRHGASRGLLLALKRLVRCRPFVQGGFDPVPTKDELDRGRVRTDAAEPLR